MDKATDARSLTTRVQHYPTRSRLVRSVTVFVAISRSPKVHLIHQLVFFVGPIQQSTVSESSHQLVFFVGPI